MLTQEKESRFIYLAFSSTEATRNRNTGVLESCITFLAYIVKQI